MDEQRQFTLMRMLVVVTAFSVTFGLLTAWLQREFIVVAAGEALLVALLALVMNGKNALQALKLVGMLFLLIGPFVVLYLVY